MNENFVGAYNRSPRWKWNRAESIVKEGGLETTALRDTEKGYEWISRAVSYLRCYEVNSNPHSNIDLIVLYGDIYTAHDIFQGENNLFRAELEASVLARMDDAKLAVHTGVPMKAIRAYKDFSLTWKIKSIKILHRALCHWSGYSKSGRR